LSQHTPFAAAKLSSDASPRLRRVTIDCPLRPSFKAICAFHPAVLGPRHPGFCAAAPGWSHPTRSPLNPSASRSARPGLILISKPAELMGAGSFKLHGPAPRPRPRLQHTGTRGWRATPVAQRTSLRSPPALQPRRIPVSAGIRGNSQGRSVLGARTGSPAAQHPRWRPLCGVRSRSAAASWAHAAYGDSSFPDNVQEVLFKKGTA